MASTFLAYQPTVRHLLNSEAMSEAQVLYGEEHLDRPIAQVVSFVTPPPRAGSLLVTRPDALTSSREPIVLKDLAAVVIIKHSSSDSTAGSTNPASAVSALAGGQALAPVSLDMTLKRIIKLCADAEVPLVLVPSFGEPGQVADDVRLAFLKELKLINARIHSSLLATLLEEGIEGLVESVSNTINRPVSVETADFKVIASRNMGVTPVSQQRTLSDEAALAFKKQIKLRDKKDGLHPAISPLKVGRRVVLPVVIADSIVGYISAMVRPTDDLDNIGELLQAASLAVMVEFSQRGKDGSIFSVTQKSLLKDLLLGHSLSASDQERLDRHYGFDMCDGLWVFAVEAHLKGLPSGAPRFRPIWPEEGMITTEVEGTRVYVFPFSTKSENTWQQESSQIIARIKEAMKPAEGTLSIQLGASRMVESSLDLPDAYGEARQALIIGSMIQGESEFAIGYGELGVKRLLYLMIDHPEFDRFYEETLDPLESYDDEWESELVPSLRVYLEQGANLNSAARALFIHRHTLRYRLEQIADILKVDIDSQEVLLNLQIAFLIKDMKGASRGKGRS